jgi:hypothetical protein
MKQSLHSEPAFHVVIKMGVFAFRSKDMLIAIRHAWHCEITFVCYNGASQENGVTLGQEGKDAASVDRDGNS